MEVRATLFSALWITLGLTFASEIPAHNAVADWHAVLEANVAGFLPQCLSISRESKTIGELR
jgi:hypothetical protein